MVKGQKILEEVRSLIDDPSYSRYNEINQAYRKICKLTKFNWLRRTNENILSFSASTTEYQLDMSIMRVLIGLYVKGGSDSRWRLLEEAKPLLFESEVRKYQDANGTDNTSKPVVYKIEGGPVATISITPTPDQSYDVRVDYIETTPEISHDTNVNIPQDYFDTVASLAAGYILERLPEQNRMIHGKTLISRATNEFQNLVRDTHQNRTLDIDRKPLVWVK